MTREQAIAFAKAAALPDYGDDFEPPEWVVVAILNAVVAANWFTATGIEIQ